MKKSWLYGKTVILTGVSSGMGRELCITLVQKYNCKVIGVARNREKCAALKELLGDNFTFELFDVGEKESWHALALRLQKEGITPDVLINNAGILPPFQRFENMDEALCEKIMQTNFSSIVYACKAIIPLLKNSPTPAILNISSSAALCPLPGAAAYCASKAAVKNFTESLSSEYDKKNFYVGVIFPGFTLTDLFREHKDGLNPNGLIGAVATPCKKMTAKIERALLRRKRRKAFGLDAKAMNFLYKLFPASAASIVGKVLKLFKVTLFEDVFEK